MDAPTFRPKMIARYVGGSILLMIGLGIFGSTFLANGIDINLNADAREIGANMLNAETPLRAKAYFGALGFSLEILVSIGLFLILSRVGPLLAGWSLVAGVTAAILSLFGEVAMLNAAEIAGDFAYKQVASDTQRWLLASLQATNDYTSFHLGLIIGSFAKAGFFYLFLKSGMIPSFISAWGVFASLFVGTTIVARDFISALGDSTITMAFMVCNLIALVSLAMYLLIWGIYAPEED